MHRVSRITGNSHAHRKQRLLGFRFKKLKNPARYQGAAAAPVSGRTRQIRPRRGGRGVDGAAAVLEYLREPAERAVSRQMTNWSLMFFSHRVEEHNREFPPGALGPGDLRMQDIERRP